MMADVAYQYDLLEDFTSGVEPGRLHSEVGESDISSAGFLHVSTKWLGDPAREKCLVWFDGTLSTEDQSTLDDIVSAHVATPLLFERFESDADQQETTSADWQTKINMQTIDLPIGDYIVYGEAVFGGTDADTEYEGRIVFCGNEVARVRHLADTDGAASSIHAERKIQQMAGVRTVQIQWRRVSGSGSAIVESAYAWVREQ